MYYLKKWVTISMLVESEIQACVGTRKTSKMLVLICVSVDVRSNVLLLEGLC